MLLSTYEPMFWLKHVHNHTYLDILCSGNRKPMSAQAMHLLQCIQCGAEFVSPTLCTVVIAAICQSGLQCAYGMLPMVIKQLLECMHGQLRQV